MNAIIEGFSDRLLGALVPSIIVQAAGAGTSACVYKFCHCVGCGSRLRRCCNGTCTACNYVGDCSRPGC